MKWIVKLEYESGSDFTKLSGIHFKEAVYGGYGTKEEALEAFCQGQVSLSQLREEREAEQKKGEGWDKAIKEAKEKYGYGKPEERIDVVRDFSPKEEKKKPVFYSKTFPPTIEERIEALEKIYRRLLKDYKTHLAFNHNYTMTPKDMELIRQYEPEE
ncbi:hypothetical protein J6U78_03625 [bacterium]|nr:hypothetical protein [bacterium]